MATWETVRELGMALAGVEEGTSHGNPALKVAGKNFVNMSGHEEGALVVRVDPDERPLLLESNPRAYFVTPHYEGWPYMLVRLDKIGRKEIAERLLDAWLLRAPKKLAAQAAETASASSRGKRRETT